MRWILNAKIPFEFINMGIVLLFGSRIRYANRYFEWGTLSYAKSLYFKFNNSLTSSNKVLTHPGNNLLYFCSVEKEIKDWVVLKGTLFLQNESWHNSWFMISKLHNSKWVQADNYWLMQSISSSRINGFFIDLEMVRQNKSRCDIGIYLL